MFVWSLGTLKRHLYPRGVDINLSIEVGPFPSASSFTRFLLIWANRVVEHQPGGQTFLHPLQMGKFTTVNMIFGLFLDPNPFQMLA